MIRCSFLIFDGSCAFCNKTLIFIAKNDRNDNFKFVSSLSEFGRKILLEKNIKELEKSSIILIEKQSNVYIKSVAIRKVLLKLPYYKTIGYLMFLFPKYLSNYIYDLISKNRKLIMNKSACKIPNTEIRKKFII